MKGKLGRLPLRSDTRALQFRSFLRRVAAEADPPADTTRFWKRRAPFPLRHFGNLQHGDCTIAKQAVAAMRMERLETRRTPRIGDQAVVLVYYQMTQRLYGGGDTGAYETDALNNWRDPDRTFRDMSGRPLTIDAYLRVDAMDHTEVKRAIALSGAHGIAVCFNLPKAWQGLDPPKEWDAPGVPPTGIWEPGSWGGHSMWAVSYNKLGPVVAHTWDLPPQQVTWEGAALYMDEAHLVIDSLDYWRKKKPAALKALKFADIRDAVNDVSSIRLA